MTHVTDALLVLEAFTSLMKLVISNLGFAGTTVDKIVAGAEDQQLAIRIGKVVGGAAIVEIKPSSIPDYYFHIVGERVIGFGKKGGVTDETYEPGDYVKVESRVDALNGKCGFITEFVYRENCTPDTDFIEVGFANGSYDKFTLAQVTHETLA